MKTTISLLAILTAMGASAAMAADNSPPFGNTTFRPYVGVEYNYIGASIKNQAFDLDANTVNDFSGKPYADSYHAIVPNIGVRIGNHFGLEAGYMRSTEEDKSLSGTDFLAGTTGKTETWIDGWHVDANGYVPLADKLEAIGSVGVGRYKAHTELSGTIVAGGLNLGGGSAKDDISDTALRLGAGLQYSFDKNLSLRGMVRYIDVQFEDSGIKTADGAWTGALGVSYTF